jgi:hypothetical protein
VFVEVEFTSVTTVVLWLHRALGEQVCLQRIECVKQHLQLNQSYLSNFEGVLQKLGHRIESKSRNGAIYSEVRSE